MRPTDTQIQQMGWRDTSLGLAEYIRISSPSTGYRVLTWTEVWETFSDAYPDRWAVQFFPPADDVVDETNIYHLFILPEEPRGVRITGSR